MRARLTTVWLAAVAVMCCSQGGGVTAPHLGRATTGDDLVDGEDELEFWGAGDALGPRELGGTRGDRVETVRQRIQRAPTQPAPALRGACNSPPNRNDVCAAPQHVEADGRQCAEALLTRHQLAELQERKLLLSARGAAAASRSARMTTLADVALEYNGDAAALAAAAATSVALGKSFANAATAWCERVRAQLATDAPEATELRVALTCLARIAQDVGGLPLDPAWPGCPCGERGVTAGRHCIEGLSTTYPFRSAPVDARLPVAIEEALSRADQVLERYGRSIAGVSVVGCHLVRLERGAVVRNLDIAAKPALTFADVSEHASGTACDLVHVWLDDGAMIGVDAMLWALVDRTGRSRVHYKAAQRIREQTGDSPGGEGARMRAFEQELPSTLADPVQRAFAVAVILRNAFADAGFVTFTPLTNYFHHDHYHIELPTDIAVWEEASDDTTTSDRREELLAPFLARAAGR